MKINDMYIKVGAVWALFSLIWYDFLAHLTNVFNLGFQFGVPFGYGTGIYEIFWSLYWGVAAILITILVILTKRE